jgi:hypothetical protein
MPQFSIVGVELPDHGLGYIDFADLLLADDPHSNLKGTLIGSVAIVDMVGEKMVIRSHLRANVRTRTQWQR